MKRNNDAVGEWPKISEQHWYVLAIVTAIFTATAVLAAFLYIFADGFDGERDTRLAQALAPFGVALFALVTFCTVSWRGSVSVRQANQAENEGRAKLLQEGAKLLSDVAKPSHISAGIASLGVLIQSRQADYAWSAMNLLADFVEDHMRNHHNNRHREEISGIMRAGDEAGFNTGRIIHFSIKDDDEEYLYDDYTVNWHHIPGFKIINYYGGDFPFDPEYEIDTLSNVKFQRVTISKWNIINIDDRFDRCIFFHCKIRNLSSLECINEHEKYKYAFEKCDFSGCVFPSEVATEIDFISGDNYFHADTPPKLGNGTKEIDWASLLRVRHEREP